MEELKSIKDIPTNNLVTGGHALCSGCGPSIGFRLALLALGPNTVVINTAGCLTLQPTYPYTPFRVPWIHTAIENAGAVAIGISRAKKILKKDMNILAYIGDGATYDIGIQSLSHLLEEGDNVYYVCYNNQNFANTGHQMTTATPEYTITKTSPLGKQLWRKPICKIVAAHGTPYVATACVSYPLDFMNKLKRSSKIDGPKFIDLLSPCQPGWGYPSHKTVKMGKLAVETGAWPLYEIVKGKFRLTKDFKKLKPVKEYIDPQKRYNVSEAEIKKIQAWVNSEWAALKKGDFWGSREY